MVKCEVLKNHLVSHNGKDYKAGESFELTLQEAQNLEADKCIKIIQAEEIIINEETEDIITSEEAEEKIEKRGRRQKGDKKHEA